MILAITITYLAINLFLAGWTLRDCYDEFTPIGIVLILLTQIAFGCLLMLCLYAYEHFPEYWSKSLVKYYYGFYFTDKFRNLTVEKIKQINSNCARLYNSESISHRLWRLLVKKINKRHNYKSPTK